MLNFELPQTPDIHKKWSEFEWNNLVNTWEFRIDHLEPQKKHLETDSEPEGDIESMIEPMETNENSSSSIDDTEDIPKTIDEALAESVDPDAETEDEDAGETIELAGKNFPDLEVRSSTPVDFEAGFLCLESGEFACQKCPHVTTKKLAMIKHYQRKHVRPKFRTSLKETEVKISNAIGQQSKPQELNSTMTNESDVQLTTSQILALDPLQIPEPITPIKSPARPSTSNRVRLI